MARLSTTAAVLITITLALLLIAFVFTGGSSGERPKASARCASAGTHEQIKAELFRRAAVIRGANDPGLIEVARYSVVRSTAPAVRRPGPQSGANCTAPIALDLPPGVNVIGGRQSLDAKVAYTIQGGIDGRSRLLTLGNADAIVVPLATIGQADKRTNESLPDALPAAIEAAPEPEPVSLPSAAAAAHEAVPRPKATTVQKPPLRQSVAERRPTRDAVRRDTVRRDAGRTQPAAQPPRPPARAAPAPAPAYAATPSFNCRRARARSEIAVCNDPALASLDRQMSSQFYSALSAASPGARAMLQRSRNRFLAERNACGSSACIAESYRRRMQEIGEIMSGRY
jgi:hypothetical protein